MAIARIELMTVRIYTAIWDISHEDFLSAAASQYSGFKEVNLYIIQKYLKKHSDKANVPDRSQFTALMLAVRSNKNDGITRALLLPETINTVGPNECTALSIASQHCSEDILMAMLAVNGVSGAGHGNGDDTDADDHHHYTPLMWSIDRGLKKFFNALLTTPGTTADNRPLVEAIKKAKGSFFYIEKLLQSPSLIVFPNSSQLDENHNPLLWAIECNRSRSVQYRLAHRYSKRELKLFLGHLNSDITSSNSEDITLKRLIRAIEEKDQGSTDTLVCVINHYKHLSVLQAALKHSRKANVDYVALLSAAIYAQKDSSLEVLYEDSSLEALEDSSLEALFELLKLPGINADIVDQALRIADEAEASIQTKRALAFWLVSETCLEHLVKTGQHERAFGYVAQYIKICAPNPDESAERFLELAQISYRLQHYKHAIACLKEIPSTCKLYGVAQKQIADAILLQQTIGSLQPKDASLDEEKDADFSSKEVVTSLVNHIKHKTTTQEEKSLAKDLLHSQLRGVCTALDPLTGDRILPAPLGNIQLGKNLSTIFALSDVVKTQQLQIQRLQQEMAVMRTNPGR